MAERKLFSTNEKLVSTTDLNSYIRYANPEFIKISGYSEKELIGSPHNIVRHPDMPKEAFKSLWLFEPIVIPTGPLADKLSRGNDLATLARKRKERFPSREDAFQRYASRPPFSTVDPDALRSYVNYGFDDHRDGDVILKCSGEVEAQVFENSSTGLFDSLSEVKVESKIAGSTDQQGPALLASDIAEALPNGTYEKFGGMTHFAPMEDPKRIAASISSFFN